MYIKKLKLTNFRNYECAELEFSPLTNIIYGNNAQGKTNILEAVYLFAQGKSHRAKTDKELVRFSADFAGLEIEFSDSRREHTGKMQILKNGRKAVKINHINISKLSQLMNYLNVVMFSPEDLNMVKGSPNIRRRFIDSAISQLYPAYLSALMEYNKVLNQKNSLLRTNRRSINEVKKTLWIWNEQLAELSVKIMKERLNFTECILTSAKAIQQDISNEALDVRYTPNIRVEELTKDAVYDYLNERADREIDAVSSLYGIQRDDLEILVEGREAKLYASQGQQRTAALSMKIAQSEYINDIKGEYPILLLDDIMSELDISRRMYLSERIRDKQVLITSTDTDLAGKDTQTRQFRIEKGTVTYVS